MAGRFHVAVLAAGVGSRLSAATDGGPKWLARVGDERLADVQLDAFERIGASEVLVVTGHASELVASHLDGRPGQRPAVLHNEAYATRNNWYSALLALRHAEASRPDETTVLVNSDLWGSVAWLGDTTVAVVDDGGAALAVDLLRPLTDEAMKVACDATGRVTRIGKVGVDAPSGEYVGVLAVDPDARRAYVDALAAFEDDPSRSNAWYEDAIETSISSSMTWKAAPVPDSSWVEIDTPEDLEAARALAGGWHG